MTSRQPAGIPSGGQFAPGSQPRASLTLVGDPLTQPLDPAAWHDLDPTVAADFERLGFTPTDAATWDALGFTPDQAYHFARTEHLADPAVAQSYHSHGLTPAEADQWAANGFAAADTGVYAGLAPHVAAQWRGHQVIGWRSWAERGLGPVDADLYGSFGIPAAQAREFRDHNIDAPAAYGWIGAHFTAAQAAEMDAHGFTPAEASTWRDAELPLPPADESTAAPEQDEPTALDYYALDIALEDEQLDGYTETVV